jgi:hypothetical protein
VREGITGEGELPQEHEVAYQARDHRHHGAAEEGVVHEVVAQHRLDIPDKIPRERRERRSNRQ